MCAASSSGSQLGAGLLGAVDGIPEAARKPVDRLLGPVELEAEATLIEGARCLAAGAVQLLTKLVEQSHAELPRVG